MDTVVGQIAAVGRVQLAHLPLILVEISLAGGVVFLGDGRQVRAGKCLLGLGDFVGRARHDEIDMLEL